MPILDTTGTFLEGIRTSTGNGVFSYPPRNLVSDADAFAARTARSEYVVVAEGTAPTVRQTDIADPLLVFRWTRTDGSVRRFSYDTFQQRWLPSPGAAPDELGTLGNEPRLAMPVPDESLASGAPYSVYIGSPTRILGFAVVLVANEDAFTDPASVPGGTVEVSREEGTLNFSQADVDDFAGHTVLATRQGFFDRTKATGAIGILPLSAETDHYLFLNPRPAAGQRPRVRLGHGPFLIPVQVANEASLGTPAAGTFSWSLDTGRVRFSAADAAAMAGRTVLYEGVFLGEFQLPRHMFGAPAFHPSPVFSVAGSSAIDDARRYVVFGESATDRYFLETEIGDTASLAALGPPPAGVARINTETREVFLSAADVINLLGRTMGYVDTVAQVEAGVSVQMARSGVNTKGRPSVPDFNVVYPVSDQVVQDSLSGSPMVMLPTVPIVNDSLSFRVEKGPSSVGRFRGSLVDGTDTSNDDGLGYILDLSQKQLRFSKRAREEFTLEKATPAVSLAQVAVSRLGLEVKRSGTVIEPGVDFDFNADAGLLEFFRPVGENDPSNEPAVRGTAELPDVFRSDSRPFSYDDVGRALLIRSGDNQGYFRILAVTGTHEVRVDGEFSVAGPVSPDIVAAGDDLADRFWTPFLPPYKKFSLSRAPSTAGPFVEVPNTEFSVLRSTGQVNLVNPAVTGEVFQATYVQSELQDDGVTVVARNHVERALFKIRQEHATFSAGATFATFNPDGLTVRTTRPVQVWINGVTQDAGAFSFIAPGVIRVGAPLASADTVVVDYWVEEAPGGNANFNVVNVPVELDSAEVVDGEQTATFNGDQTERLQPGSAVLVGTSDVILVASSSYDAGADTTSVSFETVPDASSEGGPLMTCPPVNGQFRIVETLSVDTVAQDTNKIVVRGNVEKDYPPGTVVTLNGDPYIVTGSKAEIKDTAPKLAATGPVASVLKARAAALSAPSLITAEITTTVTVATRTRRNYVIPALTRTARPVLKPGSSFLTTSPASLAYPFTLVRMGPRRKILVRDLDYTVSDGGVIGLTAPVEYGDSLHALYVAQDPQQPGVTFHIGYSHAVAPDQSNGMLGQRLLMSYDLYAPDSFYFRVETFPTMLPEFTDALEASSGGGSGPNTANASSGPSDKDMGSPSLYFSEQNAGNVDVIGIRLLKWFNDVVNRYEDVLANLDGRVVGGTSGRFRFDGLLENPDRNEYVEITNDIDDRIRRSNQLKLTGFFQFQVIPRYVSMAEVNKLSRLFPVVKTTAVAINDQTTFENLGETIGTANAENILFSSPFTTAKGNAIIRSVSGSTVTIDSDGDAEKLIPQLIAGQKVQLYTQDGTPSGALAEIVSINGLDVVLDSAPQITRGSMVVDFSMPNDPTYKVYQMGMGLLLDHETGEVKNLCFPPPLDESNPEGNEILEITVLFLNKETAPRRVPALDGLELVDDGRASQPQAKYVSETQLLEEELGALNAVGDGEVQADLVTVGAATVLPASGDTVRFTTGPNAGQERTVSLVVGATVFQVSQPFGTADSGPSGYVVVVPGARSLAEILGDEIRILRTGTEGPPTNGAVIGTVMSELSAATSIVESLGPVAMEGSGTAAPTTLTDATRDFVAAGVDATYLVWIPTGALRGLYRISEVAATTITILAEDALDKFPGSGAVDYQLIRAETFLGPGHAVTLGRFLRDTWSFADETEAWAAAPSGSGTVARQTRVTDRQAKVQEFVSSIESVLGSGEKFYEMRYLWIQQRADRKDGSLVRKRLAESQRREAERKLLADQRRLLVAKALAGLGLPV